MASGHPLTAQSSCFAQHCRRKEPQARARLRAVQVPQGRGPGGQELPSLTGVPLLAAGRLCAPWGLLLPTAAFTFYFLQPPKQEGPGQGRRTSSWRWSKGWESRKTGPGGERGFISFLCPGCTPGSKSLLRILPYGPPLTRIPSKALISHDPYLTGPTLGGRGNGEDRSDKSEAVNILRAQR